MLGPAPEFGNRISKLAADAVPVAGDLPPARHRWLLSDAVEEWAGAEHILHVPGINEFYGGHIDAGRQILKGQCRIRGETRFDRDALTT